MKSVTCLFITFFILLLPYCLFAQENCQLRKLEDGIEVFLCETENSPFKTIKVNFEVETTVAEYAAGILDVANYTEWQYRIVNHNVLKVINQQELIYYVEVETPWPLAHRDLIFHLKISQEPISKAITITLTELPDYLPEKTDIVRVPKAISILKATPINENRLKVNYVVYLDPGGEVPALITNMFAAQAPWETFYNYRNRLETKNISTADVPFIINYTQP